MTRAVRLIGVLGLLAVGACRPDTAAPRSQSAEDPTPTPAPIEGESIETFDGTFEITYRTDPAPIPLSELFDIDVEVRTATDGVPVSDDAELAVDGRMPHHRHGMNTTPRITRNGSGRFRVEGMAFHMSGRWELSFDVTRDGITERALVVVMLE